MIDLPKECRVPDAEWCRQIGDDRDAILFLFSKNEIYWNNMNELERAYAAARCAMWWQRQVPKHEWVNDSRADEAFNQAELWRGVWEGWEK